MIVHAANCMLVGVTKCLKIVSVSNASLCIATLIQLHCHLTNAMWA